ncbi:MULTISPECIES: autotransporter domain-containing protein [unclassified Beijerinckia]|uniref:autotransporter outer membrane beta-barrel domain-containing protein n=1 Tax=unclassified Beijerinckia TaxID=2638183 RepID=UPI0008963F08|nr:MULTISPECIES: autotransporter domain-containing protein [unclassified Beijerinckia]MDH7799844.1 outer membrane autotransporter protein [Beijerinckia sp. GAS462]SED39548.1 outer membrane autotransporter barrel domain-containing protein [Beijerinckia sp. 28-YEA-48]
MTSTLTGAACSLRLRRLLSTTVLTGAVFSLPISGGHAQTLVDQGTLVVSSDGQLGANSVIVDNSLGRDATLQINAGVSISNPVSIVNGGTVNTAGALSRNGDGEHGVDGNGGGTVSIAATGRIEANGVSGIGVSIGEGPVQVTNSGTIQATGDAGRGIYIYSSTNDLLAVDNRTGGRIIGTDAGVQINGNGALTNSGEIKATGADGAAVFIDGGGTVTNTAGNLAGGFNGVRIWGAGTVTNTGGAIRATTDDQGHGVEIVAGVGKVTNQDGGVISGKLYGVSLADGGTITNTGGSTIVGDGPDSIAAGVGVSGGAGAIVNTGMGSLIKGPSAGVRLINGGSVTNGAGATIQGAVSVQALSGNTTLSNAGALIGHVQLRNTGNNSVTLFTGSSITGNLQIGTNARSTLTLDGAGAQAYSAAVSGTTIFAGTLVKTGGGVWILDQTQNGLTAGETRVESGALIVNTQLASARVDVFAGGTLGGSGVVGSGGGSIVTMTSGATLAPGNSIGTLTINGDLVFNAGARYLVEVDPTGNASDLVKVTGNAHLNGGSVVHIGASGPYRLNSTYRILSADGTLSGQFDGVSSNFAFLTPSLIYDYAGRTVDLTLERNVVAFASVAATRNQIATAAGIESIGFNAGHPVYEAIAQLPNDKGLIRRSFDQLSGDIHASAKTALIEDSSFVRDAASDRIRSSFGGVAASPMPVMSYAVGGPQWVAPTTDRFAVWGQGFGAWGRTNSDGNAAALRRSTGGFLTGADLPIFDRWRLGAITGYSRTSFDVRDRSSSGWSDNYHLGLYAGTSWEALGFRTGVAYTWHDIGTSRSVALPGFSNSLKTRYDAGTFQAFGEFGYRIDTNVASFEPFANLAYVSQRTASLTEQGGVAALRGNGQTTNVAFTTLGARASTGFVLAGINLTARGAIGWRHAYGDTTPLATLAFSAGNAFSVAGVPIAKNAALVEAGLDLKLTPQAALGLSYHGQIANSAGQHGFKANLTMKF